MLRRCQTYNWLLLFITYKPYGSQKSGKCDGVANEHWQSLEAPPHNASALDRAPVLHIVERRVYRYARRDMKQANRSAFRSRNMGDMNDT